MESRVEKYRKVQAEITRLTSYLMTQYWMSADQAHEEAVRIEARTRRKNALANMEQDWYSWIREERTMPGMSHEHLDAIFEWF
jgi:hypothetical protein